MTNKISFLQGLKQNLPQSAPTNALLFVTDTGELYKGTGTGLMDYGSVLSGYADLADLQAKNPAIENKLYLVSNDKLYSYAGGTYNLVSGASEITSFDAINVTFDKSTSALTGENVQDAIVELDAKAETNKTDITDVKGRVDVLETDNTQNKADIAELQTNEGQVKLDASDTLGFLSDKVDGVTVVVENGKVIVKSLDGLTVGSTELNQLTGVTSNVQQQINDVIAMINATSSGLSFGGTVNTKAELDALTTVVNGTLYVVLTDETQENTRTMYIYSEDTSTFQLIGKFEFATTLLGLSDTPNAYEEGKFLVSSANGIVFKNVDWSDIQNKPTSTITEIDDAVLLSHEHANVTTLDKFGEDVDGKLTFNGQPVSESLQWEDFSL